MFAEQHSHNWPRSDEYQPLISAVVDASLKSCDSQEMEVTPSTHIVVIDLSIYDPEIRMRLPYPAPPPKLHFRTFWRSRARRLLHKHELEVKHQAKMEASVRMSDRT